MRSTPYLSAKAIRLAKRGGKKAALSRLQRAGILTPSGRLKKQYRALKDTCETVRASSRTPEHVTGNIPCRRVGGTK